MIPPEQRQLVMDLICEAVKAGARLPIACEEADIHQRTYERWAKSYTKHGQHIDRRTIAEHPTPHNKLTEEERKSILNIVNLPQYSDLPPSQIVPMLADSGIYIASESSFYRVLRAAKAQNHRGRSKEPVKHIPTTHIATAPNQVYVW